MTKMTLPDGRAVEVITNWIEYSWLGGMVVDPDWVGTDANGHEHRASDMAATTSTRHWTERVAQGDENDPDTYYEEYSHEETTCLTCGVEVIPVRSSR